MNVPIKKTRQIQNRWPKDQELILEGLLEWLKQVNPGNSGRLKKQLPISKTVKISMACLEDGNYSLSNHLSENGIRPITVGLKNWLFSYLSERTDANSVYLTVARWRKSMSCIFMNI